MLQNKNTRQLKNILNVTDYVYNRLQREILTSVNFNSIFAGDMFTFYIGEHISFTLQPETLVFQSFVNKGNTVIETETYMFDNIRKIRNEMLRICLLNINLIKYENVRKLKK